MTPTFRATLIRPIPFTMLFLGFGQHFLGNGCHGDKNTRNYMDCLGEEGIDAIDWPACSPDLNPIEHCWDMVDRRVRGREHPPRTPRDNTRGMSGRTSLK